MTKEKAVQTIKNKLSVSEKEAQTIIDKAIIGGEIKSAEAIEKWLDTRFLPNIVFIEQKGYAEMCVDALKILGTTAATDYGGSRQRDLGQLWADMTRGYLGEFAFSIFAKQKYGIAVPLDHEKGKFEKYLHSDIHFIIKDEGTEKYAERKAKIKISIKTIKWNGIWLDVPGNQFSHSDAYVLVKVGTGRDHLFAYFKEISVFKDKILKVGQEVGSLTKAGAEKLFDALPSFKPIPAYICGFVLKDDNYENLSYAGKAGRKHYTINSWCGPINPGDLQKIKESEKADGKIKFEGIGKFAHDKGYLFNAGSLRWKKSDWSNLMRRL